MVQTDVAPDWRVRPLGQLAQLERGKFSARPRNDPKYYGGDIPFIQTGDVRNSRGRIAAYSQTLNERGLKVSKLFPAGTLFITIAANIGDLGISQFASACPDSLVAVRPRPGVDQGWLYFALSAKKSELESIATQNAQANLNLAKLNPFDLAVPPYPEQVALASVLEDASSRVATLERCIAKKHAIKQGMMQQLLMGRARLPGFTATWDRRRLGDLLAYEQPGRYLVSSTEYGDVGTPVLTAGKTFVLGHTTERHGIYSAVPAIIFDDFTTASKFVTFPFKAKSSAMKILSARAGVNLRHMYERMQLIDYPVVDHKRRWIAEYSKLEIEVPEHTEQCAIADVINDAVAEISALRDLLEKARAVKSGMMQQLLTGKIRLLAGAPRE